MDSKEAFRRRNLLSGGCIVEAQETDPTEAPQDSDRTPGVSTNAPWNMTPCPNFGASTSSGAAISASTAPSHPMHSSTVHYAAHYSSDAATQAAPASYGNDGRLDIEQPTGDGLALPSCSTFSGNIFAVDPNISGAGTTLVNERLDIQQPAGDGQMLPSCSMFSGNIFAADPSNSGAGTTLVNQSFPGASGESSRELRGSMDSSAALVCDICKFAFKRAHHLEEHTSDHVAGKRHQCSSCGSLWRTPSALERHLLKHNNERPFKCSVCQASFKQKAHLTSHMKKKDH